MADPKPNDKRRERRFTASKQVMVHGASQEPQPAQLLDCSPHGVALVMSKPLHVDSVFLLRIRKGRELIAYTVRGCFRVGEGEYRIGGQLIGMTHESMDHQARLILQLLLDPNA